MYLFVYTRGKFVPQKTLRWLLLCFHKHSKSRFSRIRRFGSHIL